MKKLLILLVVITTSILKSQITPYYQQQANYNIEVDVDTKNFKYNGKQQINYINNSPDTLSIVYFHLYWNAFQPNSMMDQQLIQLGKNADQRMVTPEGESRISKLKPSEIGYQKIISLKQENVPLNYTIEETIVKVKLDKPILPNTTTVFTMDWEGQIPLMIRRAGRNNNEGIDFTMTQWYPKLAEYDYEGWHISDYIAREFQGVFGNYEVKINIDKNYVVGAGGVLVNPKEVKGYDLDIKPKARNNKVTWHFKAENIHDFAWAADPDYSVQTLQVPQGPKVYLVFQKSEKTKYWEDIKPFIIKYFQIMKENFGAYPYPTYTFIQGGDGGMEYGMCSMVMGNAGSLYDLAKLMFHEASHSWFQQVLATNESMRAWMDEGFTSYAENLVLGELFPETIENYPNSHLETVSTYVNFAKSGQEEVMGLLADHYHANNGYSVASYIKGEMFLVMLEYIVGKDNFTKIMKEYFQTWKFKHPTDKDFMHIAQKVSAMDLKWYWNYMTNTTRTIDYMIKKVEELQGETKITLQNSGSFPMPVDVFIVYTNGNKEIYNIPLNLMHNSKKQEFGIPQKTLPYWKWTHKEYSFILPIPLDKIDLIMLDASQRLGDIDYQNNLYQNK
ncbi:M1 family peptidase [Apibacter muscae]|uniref:M1 family peptidase n=1 Tax=Apibacter muscae TaxID=2509004 RepID=A0A563DI70_9FLAO|nr:M1 family metallopeptidase [Apibacter muscae]TWP29779.1 M1 family peptidase [Apibacter muscae]TWP30927.1 M1 family peptidase [Apibacter muscae]